MDENVRDFTEGNPVKELLIFSWPIVLTLILQNLYNTADTIVVGRFAGDVAMGAVGSAGSIMNVFLMFMAGMTTGGGVVLSQYMGAKDYDRVKKGVCTTIIIVVLVSIVLMIVGIASCRKILILMHLEGDALQMGTNYLKIIFAGTLATAFYNMGNSFSRSIGDSVTPMIVLIVTAVLNIGLNILLVAGFQLGASGVAYATIISTLISAVVCWSILLRKFPMIRPDRKNFRLDREMSGKVVKIGIPSILQSSTMTIGGLGIQFFINAFDSSTLPVMASYAAAMKIEQMITFPPGGVSDGMQVFAGQNVGAHKYDRVGKGLRACLLIIAIYSIFAALSLLFGSGVMMSWFTSTEATINLGRQQLAASAAGVLFCGVDYTMRYSLTGCGDATASSVLSVISLVIRIGSAYILAFHTSLGYVGVFWATPIAWTITSFLGIGRYLSGRWKGKSLT